MKARISVVDSRGYSLRFEVVGDTEEVALLVESLKSMSNLAVVALQWID